MWRRIWSPRATSTEAPATFSRAMTCFATESRSGAGVCAESVAAKITASSDLTIMDGNYSSSKRPAKNKDQDHQPGNAARRSRHQKSKASPRRHRGTEKGKDKWISSDRRDFRFHLSSGARRRYFDLMSPSDEEDAEEQSNRSATRGAKENKIEIFARRKE